MRDRPALGRVGKLDLELLCDRRHDVGVVRVQVGDLGLGLAGVVDEQRRVGYGAAVALEGDSAVVQGVEGDAVVGGYDDQRPLPKALPLQVADQQAGQL